jgi:hypothetical protein
MSASRRVYPSPPASAPSHPRLRLQLPLPNFVATCEWGVTLLRVGLPVCDLLDERLPFRIRQRFAMFQPK